MFCSLFNIFFCGDGILKVVEGFVNEVCCLFVFFFIKNNCLDFFKGLFCFWYNWGDFGDGLIDVIVDGFIYIVCFKVECGFGYGGIN